MLKNGLLKNKFSWKTDNTSNILVLSDDCGNHIAPVDKVYKRLVNGMEAPLFLGDSRQLPCVVEDKAQRREDGGQEVAGGEQAAPCVARPADTRTVRCKPYQKKSFLVLAVWHVETK